MALSTDDEPIYKSFQHPENLFSIDYPSHWNIQSDVDGAVEFTHPEWAFGLMIFKTPFRMDTHAIKASGGWEAIAHAMLQQVDSQNVRHDPTIVYDNYTADRPEPEQGGQRWFVLVADLILGISSTVSADAKEAMQVTFERMLASLRVDRDDELLHVRVMNRVQSQLNQVLPDDEVKVSGQKLVTNRFEITIENLFPQVKRNPEKLNELVDQFVEGLVGMVKSEQPIGQENWLASKDRIQPIIKPDKYLQEVNQMMDSAGKERGNAPALLVSLPWLADLRVCFAIDDAKTFRYVTNLDINRWEVTLEELAQIAIENLQNLPTPKLSVGSLGEGNPKIGALEPTGGAAASYLLHPLLFSIASQHLGPRIFAAIPSRDSLILFEDQGQRDLVQRAVLMDFRQTNHPISDRLFRVTRDGIALY